MKGAVLRKSSSSSFCRYAMGLYPGLGFTVVNLVLGFKSKV